MIIAVDGPAGSGKSTVSKIVASTLNISYLDTGAMYRMVTYSLIQSAICIDNEKELEEHLMSISIDVCQNNFILNNVNVNQEIRSAAVSNNVSKVASKVQVRKLLVKMQRNISKNKDIILDGRDIGTIVFPEADYKFFLTASAQVRAKRRFQELKNTQNESTYEDILANILSRDVEDSTRKIGPLKKAKNATEINTDYYSRDEVVTKIIESMGV